MTDRGFQRANDESRERLARLVETLTPTQLAVDLGEGWTVASALANMGFWDRWQAERLTEMLAGRWSAQDESVIAAEHVANEALHPYWAGVDAEDVPALALEAATRLDALIAAAPDAIVDALDGTPSAYLLHRHHHRGDHLDHIERSITAVAESVDRSFVERNAESRRRLAALVERLRESDLTRPTEEDGWTIAQVLGHLAFWDRSTAARWQAAREAAGEGGIPDPIAMSNRYLVAINPPVASLIGSWTAQLGTAIASEALAAAESIDALIEGLAGGVADSLVRDKPNFVDRSIHRGPHLEQVERALAAGRPAAPPVDRSYVDRNEVSRARLSGFLAHLIPADLALPAGDGAWTVGQILGHLTFWDRFVAARWRAALAGGPGRQPTLLPHDLADLLNDGLPPTWAAFASGAGEAAIAETMAGAGEVDRMIAGLPVEAPIGAILRERPALLDRSIHRLEHMEDAEKALAMPRG